jgi:hydrogenase nickel incorporation protein HypA/HybF
MHEYSLAGEVIRIVSEEAEKRSVRSVAEVIVEVGELSGVEAEAFEFSLGILAKDSLLTDAVFTLNRTTGAGYCSGCRKEFAMHSVLDTCPECGFFPSEIRAGREFRVVSFTPAEENSVNHENET